MHNVYIHYSIYIIHAIRERFAKRECLAQGVLVLDFCDFSPEMRSTMTAKIYGHRGAMGERPENTLAGFIHARSLGVTGIETDVVMTQDLVPVLHHDAILPDGRCIKSMKASELPEHIPILAEVLRELPDLEWLLEVKSDPAKPEQTHPPALIVTRVLAELTEMDWSRLRIWAFNWEVLHEVGKQAPGLRRGCFTGNRTDIEAERDRWLGPAFAGEDIAHGLAAHGVQSRGAFHAMWSAAEIARAHALGLEVFACFVNETADFNRLNPLVDGVITDYPSRFLPS